MRSLSSPAGSAEHSVTGGVTAAEWAWDELGGQGRGDRPAVDPTARHTEELEHAYRQGRLEGEEAGRLRARQELKSVLASVQKVLAELRGSRETWMSRLEENLIALSTAVARQLLGRELQTSPDAIRELVLKAAATFPRDQAVRVRMHPTDLARLGDGGDGVPSVDVVGGRDARWIADEEIVPGGYVIEGPQRIADGRVDEALERVFRELTHG